MNIRHLVNSTVCLCILLIATPIQAALQHYQASIEQSEWHVFSSRLRCELHHPVPRYGLGSFVYSAGGELAFLLHAVEASTQDRVANVLSISPFWKPGEDKELGQLSMSRGKTPFYVTRRMARRMLYELDAGRIPTMQYKIQFDDWDEQSDDVVVALSSVNFHQVLPEFQRCISELLPYGYDDLKNQLVHFSHNKAKLSAQAQQLLSRIATYASLDDKMDIQVKGHTDSRGGRNFNQRLSQKRNNAVMKYFTDKGVSPEQIKTQAYGERKPISSNRRATGRAKNRRVEVTISHLQQETYPLH